MGETKRAQCTALPWVARNSQHGWSIAAHRPHAVTSAYNEESIFALTRPPEERKANALVAAAGPELLAALLEFVDDGFAARHAGTGRDCCRYCRAAAAIAKAEGRP